MNAVTANPSVAKLKEIVGDNEPDAPVTPIQGAMHRAAAAGNASLASEYLNRGRYTKQASLSELTRLELKIARLVREEGEIESVIAMESELLEDTRRTRQNLETLRNHLGGAV